MPTSRYLFDITSLVKTPAAKEHARREVGRQIIYR
jgi:hypothetical protein